MSIKQPRRNAIVVDDLVSSFGRGAPLPIDVQSIQRIESIAQRSLAISLCLPDHE